MNYYQLKDEIENLVDPEDKELVEMIPDLINEAYQHVANEPGVILPGLKVIATTDTIVSQSYSPVVLADSATFSGKLLFASVDGVKIPVHLTLEDLFEAYPALDEEGDVEAVAMEGNTLWYVKQPAAATSVMLLLYQNPSPLVDSTDEPSFIPEHLQRRTIIPYAAKVLFERIEQDSDGEQPQTRAQEYQYKQGVLRLREFIAARKRGMSRSMWNV